MKYSKLRHHCTQARVARAMLTMAAPLLTILTIELSISKMNNLGMLFFTI
jgi:hypothetical protein